MSVPKLIQAMHTSCGCQVKSCTEWLSAAQTFDALGAAFRKVYGKKLPSVQKLGRDLTAWAGKAYGDLRLISIYNTDVKAARYAVETQAESQRRENKEWNQEERQEFIDADKEQRAIKRLLKAADEVEEAKRDAEVLEKISAFKVEVAPEQDYGRQAALEASKEWNRVGQEPAKSEPELEAPAARETDGRPPWLIRGESIARDKAEWLAWQRQRMAPAGSVYVQEQGLEHPGYYVALETESRMLPMPGLSGPSGIRHDAGGITTGWNGKLSGL